MEELPDKDIAAGRPVFLSWTPEHGRNEGLAEHLGLDQVMTRTSIPNRAWSGPLRWTVLAFSTWRELRRRRPSAMIVMQPPVFLLAVAVAYSRGRVPIVVDIHHGPFEERKWRWSLGWTLRLMKRCQLATVTNAAHQNMLAERGIAAVVLHNAPARWPVVAAEDCDDHVFVPLSYSPDEPVEELLEAAGALGSTRFVLTGRAPTNVRAKAPSNVEFVGFVPKDHYVSLLSSAAAVVCFTDKPNTMQQGGYEALAAERPLVTTDSEALRAYFGEAASYADPRDADSVRAAITSAIDNRTSLARSMKDLCREYRETYDFGLDPVRLALNGEHTEVESAQNEVA